MADKAARKSKIVRLNLPGVLNVLMSDLSPIFNHFYLLFSSFISSNLLNICHYVLSNISL